MVLNEVGVVGNPFAQTVEERGLEAREAIVESGNVWLGKLIGMRIALPGQSVDDWPAGIAQPHHLRTLVDSLAGCIVDGLSEYLHVVIGIDSHNLRVAATHQQTKERKRGSPPFILYALYKVRHDVSL